MNKKFSFCFMLQVFLLKAAILGNSVRPNQEFYRTTEPNRTMKKNTEPNRTVPNRRPNQYWTQILILIKNVIFTACFLVCKDHFSSYKYKTWHSFLQKQHFAKFQFSLKNFLHLISQFMLLFLLFPLLGSVSGSVHRTTGSAEPPNLTEPVVLPNYRTEPKVRSYTNNSELSKI